MEWKGLEPRMISLVEHVAYMYKTFKMKPPPDDFLGKCAKDWAAMRETQELKPPATDQSPQGLEDRQLPKIVKDPAQLREMAEKLIDAQIEHLEMLDRTRGQHFAQTPQALAEFSPRFYANACRDLRRAVEWYAEIKRQGL